MSVAPKKTNQASLIAPSVFRKDEFKNVIKKNNLNLNPQQFEELWELATDGRSGDPLLKYAEDPDDYDLGMRRAKEYKAINPKDTVYHAKASITNLAGLNSVCGRRVADGHLKRMVESVRRRVLCELKKAGVPNENITCFRLKGKEINLFIVQPEKIPSVQPKEFKSKEKFLNAKKLEHVIEKGEIEVVEYIQKRDKLKNNHFENPKDPNELGCHLNVISVSVITIEGAGHGSLKNQTLQAKPRKPGRSNDFKSEADFRKEEFRLKENAFGGKNKVTVKDKDRLYELAGGNRFEKLTGFNRAPDRELTMKRAIEYIKTTGSKGAYVEVDIRNLGGLGVNLNKKYSNKEEAVKPVKNQWSPEKIQAMATFEADEHFVKMCHIVLDTLLANLKYDISAFRHGGDELSFIIVGKSTKATETFLEKVKDAMINAQTEVSKYVKNKDLAGIAHKKHFGDTKYNGTGIVFGLAEINTKGKMDDAMDRIFSAADKQVEDKKDNHVFKEKKTEK